MKTIGTYKSKRFGVVEVVQGNYGGPDGPVAIQLFSDGEPLATLSVNMYRPECSQDSRDLPKGCFYMKEWSENELVAAEAKVSGLFAMRPDLPIALSGYVSAEAWEAKV
jgi:hypothetical protein